jgi:hypothetical protein
VVYLPDKKSQFDGSFESVFSNIIHIFSYFDKIIFTLFFDEIKTKKNIILHGNC